MEFLKRSFVKYGLIMLGITALCLALMEITGNNETFDNKSPITLVYMFIAPAVVWYLGIREKKKSRKGKLTFKQGLSEGFKISLVYAVTSPFLFLAYYTLINPGILEYVRTAYQLEGTADTFVISIDMLVQFIAALLFGTLYAAIISFFVKSRK